MPDDMEENSPEVSDQMSDNGDEAEAPVNEEGANMPGQSNKYDAKDPLRPRRKKARRACYACQRAHLTCGDERPCKRCVKRGLATGCQDGVRKKAKYLHDAPEDALGPVLGPSYNNIRARPISPRQASSHSHSDAAVPAVTPPTFLPRTATPSFPIYPAGSQAQVGMPDSLPFNPQASPVSVSTSYQAPAAGAQSMTMLPGNTMDLSALFDPSNPALYNFDLEGLNFGSQYAGWEFGILNKMALGAETPPCDNMSQTADANYAAMFSNGATPAYDAIMGSDFFGGVDSTSNFYTQDNLQHGLPHAYAIAAGPTSLASPSTDATASPQATLDATLDASPGTGPFGGLPNVAASTMKPRQDRLMHQMLGKRQRDSAAVYASVKEPYPYTAGFHNMISVIKHRLPLNKLLLIARSLGEIRPSFISCTKDLTREDLVFMEKCFQRTLVEFDDFLQHSCAPTIVCRRSGEVAAVNKEFTALTRWTKEVLLGKEPNRNAHARPASNGGSVDGDSAARTGDSTAETREGGGGGDRPQPVFLAELLDDDSVVQFYRDFAQLAFEDSRGKVQRSCSLLKYRTQDELDGKARTSRKDAKTSILSSRVTRIDGEHGISRIAKDGKVNCTYCWTIKRDVFDIPMMIIMNFLPRYYPNQGPQQLAV
ncbi:hypothetical protein RJ55_00913 [Drechmeria coniospora]|nr:hypothetical protein RJ55_00913 [Drechmeria coniospora]